MVDDGWDWLSIFVEREEKKQQYADALELNTNREDTHYICPFCGCSSGHVELKSGMPKFYCASDICDSHKIH